MFFKKFPVIQYSLDGYSKDAMNIVTAAILKRVNVDKSYVYQQYDIPNGATPESLANELYKDPNLGWTFFLVNAMVNPLLDWPMEDSVLEEYTVAKHGSLNKIVHFIDLNTGFRLDDYAESQMQIIISNGDAIPVNISPVQALAFEADLNRKRGRITIIAPRYINSFVDLFHKSIEGKI
jgi:hypothetical protein